MLLWGPLGGKFLGFMITYRGIEGNSDKCRAVIDMRSLNCINEVQRLTRRIVTLSRFMERSVDRSHLFYKVLKNAAKFEWTEECKNAFNDRWFVCLILFMCSSCLKMGTIYFIDMVRYLLSGVF